MQGVLIIQNCRIQSLHGGGVRVTGHAAPVFMSNEVTANSFGIFAAGSTNHNTECINEPNALSYIFATRPQIFFAE